MKKRLRLLPLLLALLFIFVACQSDDGNTDGTDKPDDGTGTTTDQPDDGAGDDETDGTDETETPPSTEGDEALLRMTITQAINTFNPYTAESAIEYMHQQWVNANLYLRMWDADAQDWYWAPELADGEPIDVNGDGKTWNVELKQGFTFEDGTPINAEVVEYSYKVALDPKLANRNNGGFGKALENGEAYYLGEVESWEDVGIKVVGEYTVQFIMADEYCPYPAEDFKEALAHVGAGIVHPEMFESCFNADRTQNTYGTTPERFVAGGAYTITGFIDGQYTEMTKRESGHPWAEDGTFTVDVLQLSVVVDDSTRIQMYKNGEIDIAIANTREYDDYPDVFYLYTADNYGIFINSESNANPVLQDVNFRYAMYWGFDREKCLSIAMPTNRANPYHYSHNVMTPDPEDATRRINMREQPESQAIRMDGHELTDSGYDETLALEYFEKAYVANGSKKIEVEMQYSEGNEERKAWAEAIQYHFNELFDSEKFNMTLRAVPHASIYENMSRHGHETGEMPFDMSCTAGIYQSLVKPWDNSNWVYSGPDVYSSQYTLLTADTAAKWDELYYECTMGTYLGYSKEALEGKIKNAALMEELLYKDCTFIPAYTRGNRYLIAEHIDIPFDTNVGDAYMEFALMQATYN